MALPNWAREVFARVIVVDTETGGLDPNVNAILSVAAVTLDLEHQVELKIADSGRCDPEALKVNGIDVNEHCREAMSSLDAALALSAFVEQVQKRHEGKKLYAAGHNVAFDLAFVRRLFGQTPVPLPPLFKRYQTIDTHTMLWTLYARGQIPASATSLDGAFEHFKIDVQNRHTALGDAIATARLIHKILDMDR